MTKPRFDSHTASERLLTSQKRFYELRAPDFRDESRPWDRKVWGCFPDALVGAVVDAFGVEGDVLEFACGPGTFTAELARRATSVTAIDASPAMLERNRRELEAGNVRRIEADLFSWRPDRAYDGVFFGFWLSHVPPDRFDAFWSLVAACLAPGGRVGLVDEDDRAAGHDETTTIDGVPTARRRLADGRVMDIVKVFWRPSDLQARLRALGWEMTVRPLGESFLCGTGRPTRGLG
jgi:demethylmenaquinone methyltransferase/2-methoxy-6-polyprenyl-1,4-benzoquinol methylase